MKQINLFKDKDKGSSNWWKDAESHLIWFGHEQSRTINALVRKSHLIQVDKTKEV